MQGQTVRLFLVEGTATGILTAEIMNWTGHLLVTPRSKLAEALRREETSRTGVYLLVGSDPDQPGKMRIYVGEADCVRDRLKMHAKDPSKDFWQRAVMVTSKDANLTKAHVRYLENRLVQAAKVAGRATVANGNQPSEKQLPESDVADMEFFLQQLQLALPIVGVDALRSKPKASQAGLPNTASVLNLDEGLELVLESKKHGINATAIEKDGEVTILAGSTATASDKFKTNTYAELRNGLIADHVLTLGPEGDFFVFNADVSFPSPSAAAAVVFNRNSNGRTAWKVKSTGQTLKDWQDEQLEQVPGGNEHTESIETEAAESPLPQEDSDLEQLIEYCLSLDGYAGGERTIDACFEIAGNVERQGFAHSASEDLKVAAFIWQRAFAWCSPQEQPIYERKIRSVISELRDRQNA